MVVFLIGEAVVVGSQAEEVVGFLIEEMIDSLEVKVPEEILVGNGKKKSLVCRNFALLWPAFLNKREEYGLSLFISIF